MKEFIGTSGSPLLRASISYSTRGPFNVLGPCLAPSGRDRISPLCGGASSVLNCCRLDVTPLEGHVICWINPHLARHLPWPSIRQPTWLEIASTIPFNRRSGRRPRARRRWGNMLRVDNINDGMEKGLVFEWRHTYYWERGIDFRHPVYRVGT